jgi:hypothetical protein
MPIFFRAPWSNTLKITSVVFTGVILLVMVLAGPVGVVFGAAILLLGGFMIVRGYSIREGQISVHGLVWNKSYPIATLCDLESSPFITAGSIRTFGIGGLFSFWGYFKNPTLGNYLSYITDPANSVVLYYDNIRIVISPEDPEGFIEEVRREYKRTRIT